MSAELIKLPSLCLSHPSLTHTHSYVNTHWNRQNTHLHMHPPTLEGKYANFFHLYLWVSISWKHTESIKGLWDNSWLSQNAKHGASWGIFVSPWKHESVKLLINNLIKLWSIKSRGVGYYIPNKLCDMAKLKPEEGCESWGRNSTTKWSDKVAFDPENLLSWLVSRAGRHGSTSMASIVVMGECSCGQQSKGYVSGTGMASRSGSHGGTVMASRVGKHRRV